jgi:hypothetical protein
VVILTANQPFDAANRVAVAVEDDRAVDVRRTLVVLVAELRFVV